MTRFLVVEDQLDQSEALKVVLDLMGHQAYLARTTAAAEELAGLHPPGVVVLDLILPGDGSLSFLRWLREREETAAVPVVISTGLPPEKWPDFDGLDPVKVLIKPWDVDALFAAVADLAKLAKEKGQGGPTT